MADAPTFPDFRDHILQSTRDIADSFTQPDDDWQAMLLGDTERDGLAVIPLRGPMADRPELAYGALVEVRARLAAHVQGGHQLTGEQAKRVLRGQELRPRENPDSTEVLVVRFASAVDSEVWIAEVGRDDQQRRTLGEYEEGKALGAQSKMLRAAILAAERHRK